jgi:hypothetical protein
MAKWFRWHANSLDDHRLQSLPCEAYKFYSNLGSILAENDSKDGIIPCLEKLSWRLRMSPERAQELVTCLFVAGLLVKSRGGLRVKGWEKRQYISDASTERVRKHRSMKRSETVTVTPPDTDTDTETDTETEQTTNVVCLGAKRAPTTRKRLPEDWQPRQEDCDTLCSEGFSLSEIQTQLVRFRDYWIGHGKPMADWNATFRGWVRRSAEMGARGQGPPGLRKDGMRVALDKLGGNHGAGLGSLSDFLAIPSNGDGGAGIIGSSSDQRASDNRGEANPLSISKGEQSDRC